MSDKSRTLKCIIYEHFESQTNAFFQNKDPVQDADFGAPNKVCQRPRSCNLINNQTLIITPTM